MQPVPLDEHPIHQAPLSLRHVPASDRNFYDRCYYNAHDRTGDIFLITGGGVYPNLGVVDAYATVRRGDTQWSVRCSDAMDERPLDLEVGPYRVEVIEPLKELRLICDADEQGIGFDLRWHGSHPAVMEQAHLMRKGTRAILDASRFAQLGSWEGVLRVDGEEITVDPDTWVGSRDRSWGIRPVGEAEAPGNLVDKPAAPFRWLYAPFRMEDHALVFICQERGDGSRVLEEAVRLWPNGGVDHLGRPEHDLQWNAAGPGLFGIVEKGTIRLGDLEVTVEPVLPVHIGVGTGYGFDGDGWKHGAYQGELEVQGKVFDLGTDEGRGAMFGIVDSVARFEVDGQTGWGLFEHLHV
jgi:hypothetical protein